MGEKATKAAEEVTRPEVVLVTQRFAANTLVDTVILHIDTLTGVNVREGVPESQKIQGLLQAYDVIQGTLVQAFFLQNETRTVVMLDEFLQVYLYPETKAAFGQAAPLLSFPLSVTTGDKERGTSTRRVVGNSVELNDALSDRYVAIEESVRCEDDFDGDLVKGWRMVEGLANQKTERMSSYNPDMRDVTVMQRRPPSMVSQYTRSQGAWHLLDPRRPKRKPTAEEHAYAHRIRPSIPDDPKRAISHNYETSFHFILSVYEPLNAGHCPKIDNGILRHATRVSNAGWGGFAFMPQGKLFARFFASNESLVQGNATFLASAQAAVLNPQDLGVFP
ncbi:hypothetical protein M378DRAFT_17437 [Amanita muscaria Koide BX008]|uniref:Uncharacterized protein n=1 Tax=Amanita muscaria (strain Koide BX008) TaxID=946122 RepID=A0A0C2WHE0_AMAMK|nr:hypothetical protein M378DRAFT_17437 [Amanita muscaria Koide BX008]